MEKINIAELLKDCPKGMELDCTIYNGRVCFEGIDARNPACPIIKISVNLVHIERLDAWGQYSTRDYSKCVIFPKGKTTWEGFIPPCKFKDGDILFVDFSDDEEEDKSYQYIFILNKPELYGKWHSYCFLNGIGDFDLKETYLTDDKYHPRFATKEEKQKLFNAIKKHGYKWNPETKTLEKLIEPNFNVGDEIKYKYPTTDTSTLTIIKVEYDKNRYVVCDKPNNFTFLSFFSQDNFNFIRKTKFDITTLVPFESRVLVRDGYREKWKSTFWGFYDSDHAKNYPFECCGTSHDQCIPYEGNEHLLGKTDDCDEYYKTWE